MDFLRLFLESYGIVLPEPNARRLLAALDMQEGWSGGEGRYLHTNARRPIPTSAGGSVFSVPFSAASCPMAASSPRP